MSCEIQEIEGVTINGSTKAYGGALQSFSLTMGGLASQIKATATLVGASQQPRSGDSIVVNIARRNFKMQVGGYDVKSDGAGADQMTLQLYDTSNIFLDNHHIVLQEEVPKEGGVPGNISVLGIKYGPLPSPDKAENGIISAESDTEWGDLRHWYEQETPDCREEGEEEKKARIDQNIAGAPGKTLYPATGGPIYDVFGFIRTHTLETLLSSLGVMGGGNQLVGTDCDYKGSLRDVITQYCNNMGLIAWWDMETESVVIKRANSVENGFAKISAISDRCEILSSSQSVDYTPTLGRGALGSITSSFQGENQGSAGREPSKFLNATLLQPIFKYKKCRNKGAGDNKGALTVLKFDDATKKAIQAAVNPKLFAAYALQSALSAAPEAPVHAKLMASCATICPKFEVQGTNIKPTRECDAGEWANLLPEAGPMAFAGNSLLRDYYEVDPEIARTCGAFLTPVKIGSLNASGDEIAVRLCQQIVEVANADDDPDAPQDPKAKDNAPKGWNNKGDADPKKTMGDFKFVPHADKGKALCTGSFERGSIVLHQNPYFDSILGTGGLAGDNDILRMYLLAIQKFRNRFYVIKEGDEEDGCPAQSVNVKGRTYGYYITSETQNAPVSFKPMEGYKVVSVNPFVPLGECSCGELVALAQTLAMMYLPPGKKLAEVMGLRPDPDNPIKALQDGFSGGAVIDFIYALESDSEKPPPGEKSGLELFFNGDGNKAKPVRRAKSLEETKTVVGPDGEMVEKEVPQLTMHLLVADPPEAELQDVPQIGFMANADQREAVAGAANLGEFQPQEVIAGPAMKAANELVINLSSTLGGNCPGLAKVTDNQDPNQVALILWGVKETDANGGVIDLNGNIPEGYFKDVNNAAVFAKDAPFIPAASLNAPDASELRVWYRVNGADNSINSNPGEFSINGLIAPVTNCWTSKIDFGVSVNAADVGQQNAPGKYKANAKNMGNQYSYVNRLRMTSKLYQKLGEVATAKFSTSESRTISYVATKRFTQQGFELPDMADGLESLSFSLSGTKTEVGITVGNSVEQEASKKMYERMVQSPGTLYRPGSVMPDSFMQNTTPRFQNFMKGR